MSLLYFDTLSWFNSQVPLNTKLSQPDDHNMNLDFFWNFRCYEKQWGIHSNSWYLWLLHFSANILYCIMRWITHYVTSSLASLSSSALSALCGSSSDQASSSFQTCSYFISVFLLGVFLSVSYIKHLYGFNVHLFFQCTYHLTTVFINMSQAIYL